MIREIILDTETTGLEPKANHRIIEIGCVEVESLIPTGRTFHTFINPERDVPIDATQIHGLTTEFLLDKPLFIHIADEFLTFLGDSRIVAHNASFDIKFINAELSRLNRSHISMDRVIDSVSLARQKFPGAPANLDALCRRFGIDLSARSKHGALTDAHLLAKVYLELNGGRQVKLTFEANKFNQQKKQMNHERPFHSPRHSTITEEERQKHSELLQQLKDPLWSSLLQNI